MRFRGYKSSVQPDIEGELACFAHVVVSNCRKVEALGPLLDCKSRKPTRALANSTRISCIINAPSLIDSSSRVSCSSVGGWT